MPLSFVRAEPDEHVGKKLHPTILRWFARKFGRFTSAQLLCIGAILRRESVLLSSPTGSGKTLAAFLGILDHILRGRAEAALEAIYVSPLRALTYDIQKNLREPIAEMHLAIRVMVRTGDTSQKERQQIKRRPPEILLITPESLAIILCQREYIDKLAGCQFVIVDELHSIAENKRGVDLMMSIERLQQICPQPLCRIGLSATVAPLERMAEYLVGPDRPCVIAEAPFERKQVVEVFSPVRRNPYPPAGYTGTRVLKEVAKLVAKHRSVLIFCNTRSGAETVGFRLKQSLPELEHRIEIHHSSLDRSLRLRVEDRLKNGELRAVVCSTSLEMGIDIGAIDLAIMISNPKGISRTLQRIGRAGHSIHQTSYGVLVATNINDLVECIVTARLVLERRLDPLKIPGGCNDVIAQQIVGMAMASPITIQTILDTLRRSWSGRNLSLAELQRILTYLEGGGEMLGRQYAELFGKIKIEGDLVRVPSRRVEREFLLNIGTIPAEGMVTVYLGRRRLGQVEQGFIKQLNPGDRFVLGGKVVELVESGAVVAKVKSALGEGPIVPSWNANKMPLTSGIAQEVVRLRSEVNQRLDQDDSGVVDWLVESQEISPPNAQAVVNHFRIQRKVSRVPVERLFLVELFVSESGMLNYFFHALIGRSGNDALSRIVSYRIKQRVGGNALATIDDYGFLLAVRPSQRLRLEQIRDLFQRANAEKDLAEALKNSELVRWQFRGVAQTGLMVPRNRPEGERRLREIHWSAEILFRVLQEHEPDHPLLEEAYRQAEFTFLDAERAFDLMNETGNYEWDLRPVEVVSPFAFGMYVSQIKEAMLHEDPESVIERLYHEMYGPLLQE